jgi:hypothetical protein
VAPSQEKETQSCEEDSKESPDQDAASLVILPLIGSGIAVGTRVHSLTISVFAAAH